MIENRKHDYLPMLQFPFTLSRMTPVLKSRPHDKASIPSRLAADIEPEADSLDDAELLSRLAGRDPEAFAVLVRRHSRRFYRTAYRFTGRKAEAEDIVQDAFLKLWERPTLWQAGRNTLFTTWFYRIVVNMCLDFAKKKKPLPLTDDGWIEDTDLSQEARLIEHEKHAWLESQLALLPERQRTALTLCFSEGLSNQQAADVMGVRVKALQALIMRAKTTLREHYAFYEEEGYAF